MKAVLIFTDHVAVVGAPTLLPPRRRATVRGRRFVFQGHSISKLTLSEPFALYTEESLTEHQWRARFQAWVAEAVPLQ